MISEVNNIREGMIKKCVIITGMSGGGKSSALEVLEDHGFYTIDNLPPALLPQLLDVLAEHSLAVHNGVAIVIDGRSGCLIDELENVTERLNEKAGDVIVVFLDATDEMLIKRFETTRRSHPFAADTTILGSIAAERELMATVRENSNLIVDTTDMTKAELKARLLSIMSISDKGPAVIFSSFGFKYGLPQDADYVCDVRFLPNPNYVLELHDLSGKDSEIQKYLSSYKQLDEFLSKAEELLEFIFSVYGITGKRQFHVAIGCTGGRHRSVAVTELLAAHFQAKGYKIFVVHRDIEKGSAR